MSLTIHVRECVCMASKYGSDSCTTLQVDST